MDDRRHAATHSVDMESVQARINETYPVELHHIKALFLQQQYRRAITTCREVLKKDDTAPTMSRTFARVYCAMGHDVLAQNMHIHSQAKIPAFNEAAQLYHEALLALPTPAECLESIVGAQSQTSEGALGERDSSTSTLSTDDLAPGFHDAQFRPLSPPTHTRYDSLMAQSPSNSDLEDLESHESFDQIMTPTRIPKLERDYSSFSLLQDPPRNPTHALMKPVRLGSPARPYYAPIKSRYGDQAQRSKLPKLDTTPARSDSSPVRKQLRTPSEQASPVFTSPVSPLGSEGFGAFSDTSTISPISPDTPMAGNAVGAPQPNDSHHTALEEHYDGMRAQLETHIQLVEQAKQRAIDMRAQQSETKLPPGRETKSPMDRQTRSYWSFTPDDVKEMELKRRIEAGRARGWARKRFDPTRYRDLADKALAEL